MNKNSRIFRRAAWVAVLALMLQVVMPLLHPAMAASSAMSADSGMRHCSMVVGSVDKPDPGKTPQQKSPGCPICMSMHFLAGGYVPPQPTVFIYVARNFATIIPLSDVIVTPAHIASSAQPRAPPVLA